MGQFQPMLEKEFPDIVDKMLNSQWQPLNLNENRSIPHRNREQYNGFQRGNNNRKRTLTTPNPTKTNPDMVNRFILSHTACLKHLTSVMEMVIPQTALTKQLKIKDIHIALHHSEQ